MGFGTVFSTLTFLFILVGMTVMVVSMQQTLTAAATEVKAQQQEQISYQQQEIQIQSTSYQENDLRAWQITYVGDFEQGSFTNTTTVGDEVQLQPAETSGTYTSLAYDTGHTSNYSSISWQAVLPGGASLSFQVRSGDNLTDLLAASFLGPDGTTGTTYTASGTAINDTHDTDRFIQYQATLNTSGSTPELKETSIGVRRDVGHVLLEVENSGSEKIDPDNVDVYVAGVRALRNDSHRVFTLETATDTQLWNPGEQLNITVFETLASSASVTVASAYATDAAVVTP